ncbi:hypothetical protein HFO41_35360 [Rhizobium leguminosarum]|uniref:hypothetical protein n=1 Tax=Rhizobium leguminosarum TaxID=384 RepID=UPI00098EDF0E|nr:hypothetical protein [Rhizobium leguminosarum]MBB5262789.1 hypothetical protein [Rhizobium leguminosarum]MBY3178878.1 hypothetical protein [Rhizobium leguminosarum]MBY5338666.1 hypothetical protein [Rhizobium leguminosarum]MBY5482733.1 hypothetical protein [Rhizobium leguminosarum]MBY5565618.1 hypothetical protein [Rhizobium leguminosarum]
MKKAITLHWNLSGFGKGEAVAFRVELAQGLDSVEHQIVSLTLAAGGFLPRQHRDEWIAWSYPALSAIQVLPKLVAIGFEIKHTGDVPGYIERKAA